MPATAGRVRMPANNRVHSSAALQTHGIWQSAIGYDPYAPQKDESKDTTQSSNTEAGGENAYLSFQGLLQLARITNNTDNEVRGACKKCGRVGHLTFQCKNFVSLKDEIKDKDLDIDALGGLGKVRGGSRKRKGRMSTKGAVEGSEESSEDESESSDSSVDSEMERIIAERFGKKKKKSSGKVSTARKKKHESDDEDSDDGERKKRGRSKKRSSRKKSESDSDDEDDSRRNRRKEKRRKRDDSSEDEECRRRIRKSRKEKSRRRSHRHSDDSDESPRRHKRKNRRASPASDSDVSESDDSRVGRDAKRADKKSHKRHHEKN